MEVIALRVCGRDGGEKDGKGIGKGKKGRKGQHREGERRRPVRVEGMNTGSEREPKQSGTLGLRLLLGHLY